MLNNKEIVSNFKFLLKDKKGIDKSFSYPRVMSQMKNVAPLMKDLSDDEVKELLEIIVDNYESWSSPQYPLEVPVVTRKWVIERAMGQLGEKKEEESQIVERSVEATKRNSQAVASILDRIKSKGGNK